MEVVHYLQTNLIGYDRSWNPLVYQMFGGSLGTSLDYPNLYRRPVGRVSRRIFFLVGGRDMTRLLRVACMWA